MSPRSTSRRCRPPGASLATEESPLVSPDGRLLAFVGYDAGGTQRLYVGTLGGPTHAEPLEKTEGASLPFWSPDSRALGFFAQGSLKTIDVVTRGDRRLAPAGAPRGGTWSKDGVIVFVPSPRAGPHRISAAGDGGDQTPVSSETDNSPRWLPSFLPDGRHFLEFVPTVKEPQNSGVWAVSLESGKRQRTRPQSVERHLQPGSPALLAGRYALGAGIRRDTAECSRETRFEWLTESA